MGKKTRLFKSKERRGRTDVSAFLHQLADRVSVGQVVLRQGQEEISLDLPQSVTLEVQAQVQDRREKGPRHRLELELTWSDDEREGSVELG